MKHDKCRCQCGHSADQHDENGKCLYEYWDDGAWYVGDCGCDEYWCNFAGKQYSGTVRGGCVKESADVGNQP